MLGVAKTQPALLLTAAIMLHSSFYAFPLHWAAYTSEYKILMMGFQNTVEVPSL